jgi:hypothetical protein
VTPKRIYSFMIDPDLAAALKAVKERDGVPEGEQIRRALRQWMERRGVMKAERKRAATRKRP